MKKLLVFLVLVFTMLFQSFAYADDIIVKIDPQHIIINNNDITNNDYPIMTAVRNGSRGEIYYVPARYICENLGIDCQYNPSVKKVFFEGKSYDVGALYMNGATEATTSTLSSSSIPYGYIDNGKAMISHWNFAPAAKDTSSIMLSGGSFGKGRELRFTLNTKNKEEIPPIRVEIISKELLEQILKTGTSPLSMSAEKGFDWLVKPEANQITTFSNGYAVETKVIKDEEEKRKLYEQMGTNYDEMLVDMGYFTQSFAIAKDGTKTPIGQYKFVQGPYQEGFFTYTASGGTPVTYGYIDLSGNTLPIVGTKVGSFNSGRALVKGSLEGSGYIDKTGKIVISSDNYKECYDFSEGLALVRVGDSYGFIDPSGNMAIPPQFGDTSSFQEGFASVTTSDGKRNFIDKTGKLILNEGYYDLNSFSEGLAMARRENTTSRKLETVYLNTSGEVAFKPDLNISGYSNEDFDFQDFHDGMASFYSYDHKIYGFIDKTGKIVYQQTPYFSNTAQFYYSEGLCRYQDKEFGKYGYKDKTGKIVIEAQFDYAEEFKDGFAIVTFNGGNGIIKNPLK